MYKLLIADDEELERHVLQLFVKEVALPFEKVMEAENGTDAALKILVDRPDIILLDIKMPELDGLEVLEKTRKAGCTAKFIISTAYDEFDYAVRALQLGASDFLVKPIKKDVLKDSLRHLIRQLDEEKARKVQAINFDEVVNFIKDSKSEAKDTQKTHMPDAVVRIKDYIEANYTRHIGLDDIICNCGYSKSHVSRLFKNVMGVTIIDYLVRQRMETAKEKLRTSDLSIKSIAIETGYTDPNYFTLSFRRYTGCSPMQYRMESESE